MGMFRKGMIFTQHVYTVIIWIPHATRNLTGIGRDFKDNAGYPIKIGAEEPPGSPFFLKVFHHHLGFSMRRQVGSHLEMGKTNKHPRFFFLPPFWNV